MKLLAHQLMNQPTLTRTQSNVVLSRKTSPKTTGCPRKKYTSLKSYIFVLRADKSLNFVLSVRQDLNLNFESQFFEIGRKLTEL